MDDEFQSYHAAERERLTALVQRLFRVDRPREDGPELHAFLDTFCREMFGNHAWNHIIDMTNNREYWHCFQCGLDRDTNPADEVTPEEVERVRKRVMDRIREEGE